MSLDKDLHTVNSINLLKTCLESHGAAETLYRTQTIDCGVLEHVVVLYLFQVPFDVDGRKFDFSTSPDAEGNQSYSEERWNNVPHASSRWSADAYVERSGITSSNTLAA